MKKKDRQLLNGIANGKEVQYKLSEKTVKLFKDNEVEVLKKMHVDCTRCVMNRVYDAIEEIHVNDDGIYVFKLDIPSVNKYIGVNTLTNEFCKVESLESANDYENWRRYKGNSDIIETHIRFNVFGELKQNTVYLSWLIGLYQDIKNQVLYGSYAGMQLNHIKPRWFFVEDISSVEIITKSDNSKHWHAWKKIALQGYVCTNLSVIEHHSVIDDVLHNNTEISANMLDTHDIKYIRPWDILGLKENGAHSGFITYLANHFKK